MAGVTAACAGVADVDGVWRCNPDKRQCTLSVRLPPPFPPVQLQPEEGGGVLGGVLGGLFGGGAKEPKAERDIPAEADGELRTLFAALDRKKKGRRSSHTRAALPFSPTSLAQAPLPLPA